MSIRSCPCLLFLVVLLLFPDLSWGRYDPSWSWKTHESDHFTLYYPEGHEDFAKRVLALEKEVYSDVTGYLGTAPPHCPVVLNPGTDVFNGFYSPFPNRISLYETPYHSLRGFGPSSDPMDGVFTHEFSHFVHITSRLGWYGKLSPLLGPDSSITNILSPGWIIEGVTTTAETLFTDGGRGRCTYFLGEMLSFTEDDGLWNLSAAGTHSPFAPPQGRIYLSGYHMVDYLNTTYGPDAFGRLSRYQAMHPLGLSGEALEHVTGVPSSTFYQGFLDDLMVKAEAVKKKAREKNLPEGHLLFPLNPEDANEEIADYFWTGQNTLMAFRTGYARNNAFIEIDPVTGKTSGETETGRVNALKRMDACGDGKRIIFAGAYPHLLGQGDLSSTDLTVFDMKTKRFRRLTKNAHLFSAVSSPDQEFYAAVQRNGMWTDLVLLDAEGNQSRTLVSKPGLLFEAPAFSPDGSTLACAVKSGKNTDIALVDIRTGNMETLFESDPFEDNDPSFSADGRWLLFSSNRSGMWNIFGWNLEMKKLYQLTSVAYGATLPRLSPDGKTLAFLDLHRGSRRLVTVPFEPVLETDVAGKEGGTLPEPDLSRLAPDIALKPVSMDVTRVYRPFLHIPYLVSDEEDTRAGLFVLGGDPVGLNSYQAFLDYGTSSKHTGYDVRLTNRSLWPDLTLGLYNTASDISIPGYDFWIEEKGYELSSGFNMIHRVIPDHVSSRLVLGGRYKKLESLDNRLIVNRDKDEAVSFFGQWEARRLPDAPALDALPTWGQEGFLLHERTLSGLSSEIDAENTVISLTQYLPAISAHDGFALKSVFQKQSGDMRFDKDFSLPRGYSDSDPEGGLNLPGNLLLSLEYHVPVAYPDKGWGLSLIHVHRLKGTVFSDWGAGWDGTFNAGDWAERSRVSVGASLRAESSLISLLPVEIGLEVGYKVREKESFSNMILLLGF